MWFTDKMIGCALLSIFLSSIHVKVTWYRILDKTKTNIMHETSQIVRTVFFMFLSARLTIIWTLQTISVLLSSVGMPTDHTPMHCTWPASNDVIGYSVVTPTELSVCTSMFNLYVLQMGHRFTQQLSEVQEAWRCDSAWGMCSLELVNSKI